MFEDRWYQREAVWSIFDFFRKTGGVGNPIIAMPTGTGKSIVIARLIQTAMQADQRQRFILLTHVKKLISQNAQKVLQAWPTAPLGIYSAGLNRRDMIMPIVFGGVQSVAKAIERELKDGDNATPMKYRHFGYRDVLIIDECHLLSPDEETLYQYVIIELKKINPYLVVVGLTATPYRLKQGMLTDGGIFTHICYDLTTPEAFNRLIAEGFMAPLVSRPTATQIDLSNVGLTGGDFNQKQCEAVIDTDETTFSAIKETVEYGQDRRAWLGFASGIKNCEHIAGMLQSFGIPAAAMHSKVEGGEAENDRRYAAFERGELRALVSANKLTTGVDHPPIDLIFDLQPTTSPAKHVQKAGRGTRVFSSKKDCLFLDFAGNVNRCGMINDPKIPGKPGKGGGDAPIKICDGCGVYNHASARFCFNCNFEFTFETKIFDTSAAGPILRDDAPIVELFEVQKVIYHLHEKQGSPPSIMVSYFCKGFKLYKEWVCLEHGGIVSKRARDWWRQRSEYDPPPTTFQALQITNYLRWPTFVRVHVNKRYPEIIGYEY